MESSSHISSSIFIFLMLFLGVTLAVPVVYLAVVGPLSWALAAFAPIFISFLLLRLFGLGDLLWNSISSSKIVSNSLKNVEVYSFWFFLFICYLSVSSWMLAKELACRCLLALMGFFSSIDLIDMLFMVLSKFLADWVERRDICSSYIDMSSISLRLLVYMFLRADWGRGECLGD